MRCSGSDCNQLLLSKDMPASRTQVIYYNLTALADHDKRWKKELGNLLRAKTGQEATVVFSSAPEHLFLKASKLIKKFLKCEGHSEIRIHGPDYGLPYLPGPDAIAVFTRSTTQSRRIVADMTAILKAFSQHAGAILKDKPALEKWLLSPKEHTMRIQKDSAKNRGSDEEVDNGDAPPAKKRKAAADQVAKSIDLAKKSMLLPASFRLPEEHVQCIKSFCEASGFLPSDPTIVNCYILLEQAKKLSINETLLVAPGGKIPRSGALVGTLPSRAANRDHLVYQSQCRSHSDGMFRLWIPAETLGVKLWPPDHFNLSTLSPKGRRQAAHFCPPLHYLVALMYAISINLADPEAASRAGSSARTSKQAATADRR